MSKKGTLYLIPAPIADGALQAISPEVVQRTALISHYFAENARTTRRILRAMHPDMPLEPIAISEIDKHRGADPGLLKSWLDAGHDVGLMSEAGCPGVADPGSDIVAAAHRAGARVAPLTGPSALLLALMASGLNGQNFCFNGYLPVKEPMRSKKIRDIEALSARENQTQLFIETPYRNNQLLAELLKTCTPDTRLCIALHLSAPDEWISTRSIGEWKKQTPVLEKAPAVFLLLKK